MCIECIEPRPTTESLFLASIDSQRYDLSKRRKPFPPFASSEDKENMGSAAHGRSGEMSEKQPFADPVSFLRERWNQNVQHISLFSESKSHSDAEKLKASDSLCGDNGLVAQFNSMRQAIMDHHMDCSISKHIAELFRRKEQLHTIDVYEKEDGETVRTVVRPFKEGASRPASPVDAVFRLLDCTCCNDTFEDQVDFAQVQRENRLAGEALATGVSVKKMSSFNREEKWRDTVQAILYERQVGPTADLVFGRVEVCR